MPEITSLFLFLLTAGLNLLFILFTLYSYIENEKRALNRGVLSCLVLISLSILLFFLPSALFTWIILLGAVTLCLVLIKFGNSAVNFVIPKSRFDERNVMFSRNALKEGSQQFKDYYTRIRPDNKALDDKFRAEPGLMALGSSFHNEMMFKAAQASFHTVDLLQPLVERPGNKERTNIKESEIAEFINHWTLKLGALDVGFTFVKPHHTYTHVGRGNDYGKEVTLDHTYAIAFTVEMNHEAMSHNPRGPVVMESAQQYLQAGQIAVQLAQFIRSLGFEARAHIDANYRLICPIVAQDAGLGVVGRMGLLMTPKLGPRVRIGVVSTNLKLPVNNPQPDYSVIHFCEICKKCAVNCPSQSISYKSKTKTSNPERWIIDHESCFTYWCKSGTDCGRCMAVCPYSHPDNFIHNVMRWIIRRNPFNRWLALQFDDLFYGRKPSSAKLKSWMEGQKSSE